jgi:hypothetical protein
MHKTPTTSTVMFVGSSNMILSAKIPATESTSDCYWMKVTDENPLNGVLWTSHVLKCRTSIPGIFITRGTNSKRSFSFDALFAQMSSVAKSMTWWCYIAAWKSRDLHRKYWRWWSRPGNEYHGSQQVNLIYKCAAAGFIAAAERRCVFNVLHIPSENLGPTSWI